MMKYIFVLVTVFAVVKAQQVTSEEIEKMKKIHSDCIKESSVDVALIHSAMKGEFADDQKLKNQILCANKKIGIQNENGDINEDVLVNMVLKKLPSEMLVRAAVQECAQKKDNPAETGFQLLKCLHSMAPKDIQVESTFF